MVETAVTTQRLDSKRRKLAELRCAERGERLTSARLTVYEVLCASDRPLSAYELIALLAERQNRRIAPTTVYRHLDFLMRLGLVHRLESAHAYLPCNHPGQAHESQYLVCSDCGHVDEIESRRLGTLLNKIADQHGFRPENAVVEVKGLCGSCADRQSPCVTGRALRGDPDAFPEKKKRT